MSTTISCEQNNDVDDSDLQITITNVPPPDDERKNRESISLWRRFLQGKPPSDVDPRDWPPTKKYAIILIVALSAFTYDILPHMFILVIDLLLLLVHLVLQLSMCVIIVMFIGRSRIINQCKLTRRYYA